MGVERNQDPIVLPQQQEYKTGIIVRAATKIVRPVLTRGIELLGAATQVEYPLDFGDKYIRAIQDSCIPIIVTNHTSDFDAVPVAYLARLLTLVANDHLPKDKQLENFLMITASSLREGKDRPGGEKILFDAVGPFLDDHNIQPVYVVTRNDNRRRGMPKNPVEFQTITEALIETGHHGIFLFPEATTDSGRLDDKGQLRGMQKFTPFSISTYMCMIKDLTGRDTVIIPAAISGGHKVYNHQTHRPSKEAFLGGLGIADPKIASMQLCDPIRSTDERIAPLIDKTASIRQKYHLERIFAEMIAEKLEPHERGHIYGKGAIA